ncbi:UDP-glucose--sterol glucosyltransferase [Streptomyces agglomeratus]|uniref:UDP-glucose--sterol glucosyltransferase n=2 Tax=Streptomyces agglomeratus TaxID=285458 RepID=A0A1E5PJT9_9ACTN|nr:glycosyltransferase [Streptomyces agglomeratus]OEJ29820.1 UDP-glucose--sterol glucosyltransferase [Streptomyces agglomeratus]OEJ42164.1 UDP-glucose--sterol glucosyltransferase [Streptomyces agglomeratus]OEJ49325.1 UDP-glucose--sterol glucosyltransferase [Streptomyces agglomeratus]OEJ55474.1 UDP-glucose--sterol glucosyltransferase [Streptomyces agglomeratus]OEJ62851.1 UDP-glucose--sterol glucosyltransferase [Streptomyces agglomeratus]
MTAGSRGDVAPYTGLAHGLAEAGHEVTLVTHACFAPLAEPAGVGFHPLPVDPRAELASARGRALGRSVTAVGKLARMTAMARSLVGGMADDLLLAARRSDVVLVSSSLGPLGHAVAEGLALPSMGVYLQPLAATSAFPPPVTGTRSWGAAGNRLAGRTVNAALDAVFADTARALRARTGLARTSARAARRARERQDWPVLHGFSPSVVPRPADWRPGLSITGYWWPEDPPGAVLPPGLRDFLARGRPPVFVGLGSATVPDAGRLSRVVVRALRAAGQRGVIQRGWGGLDAGADAEDMITIGEVPHAVLFPHMAAVVHHAGAGTTAAGLRAGVPAVPVPVQFDAAFWSSRLVALGVAPEAVPLRRITTARLAAALERATAEPSYRHRARALAARIGAEDGVRPVRAAVDRLAAA